MKLQTQNNKLKDAMNKSWYFFQNLSASLTLYKEHRVIWSTVDIQILITGVVKNDKVPGQITVKIRAANLLWGI